MPHVDAADNLAYWLTRRTLLIAQRDKRKLHELIAALPSGYREVIVLREIEELPCRDIAQVIGVPIGTVMSRLARARSQLQGLWRRRDARER